MKIDETDQSKQSLFGNDYKLKSKIRIVLIALSVSISALMLGYSLKQISCVPVEIIVQNYGFDIDHDLLEGILISILPFGGLFGSLLAKPINKILTRIGSMHLTMGVLVGALIIVQIPTPATLLSGRFLQGICIGYYVSIAPVYLKQISPKHLRSLTGTFFSLGKILGIIIVVAVELILGDEHWRILLSMTGFMAIIQSLLLSLIGSDTPYQWLVKGDQEKGIKSLKNIYTQQCSLSVFEEIKQQLRMEKQRNSLMSQNANQILQRKKKNALFVAVNVCIMRHFSGGNSLITSAGLIMVQYSRQLSKWTPLIINSIQLVAIMVYIFVFATKVGKRTLLISSSYMLAVINILIVVSFIIESSQMILGSLILFMFVYGGILLSAVWSYPSEIISADQSLLPNLMHWITLSISTLAPQLVMSLMPDKQVYPCFIFFFAYSLFAAVYFQRNVVESNGKTYKEIIIKFKQW